MLPIQATGLMLSNAINFILCLNEHEKQKISSDGAYVSRVAISKNGWDVAFFLLYYIRQED